MSAPLPEPLWSSDAMAGPAPAVLDAIVAATQGEVLPYGDDAWTHRLNSSFSKVFERDCHVVPVSSGIIANGLALSLTAGPMGSILCHENSHILNSETGCVEMFSDGARLVGIPGDHGRIDPAGFRGWLDGREHGRSATLQLSALSIAQATEAGTLYRTDEIAALAAIASHRGMKVHLDGARFAQAVAALNCAPAELSWKAGIDVMSLGLTKNGGMNADALIIFDPALLPNLDRRRRRAGQMQAKMRFASAQLLAYVENDLWLTNARNANRCATMIAERLAGLRGITILHPVEANMVFLHVEPDTQAAVAKAGLRFRPVSGKPAGMNLFRAVTSYATRPAEIGEILDRIASAVGAKS
jgi:threonine aldolase